MSWPPLAASNSQVYSSKEIHSDTDTDATQAMASAEYAAILSPTAAPEGARKRYLTIPVVNENVVGPSFLYPTKDCGYEDVSVAPDEIAAIRAKLDRPRRLISEWPATAISGNDLLGSVLYSAGIVASKAGFLSPVCMAMVSVVLYLFRFIYEEVVTAIPMNGGSYNCLLNSTSKRVASVAACLSILSYLATAVVSSTSASYYLQTQVPGLPVLGTSIALLGVFGLLNMYGINESALVALVIFTLHTITLTVVGIASLVYIAHNPDIIYDNYHRSFPAVDFVGSTVSGNVFTALFFGFSASMLGVTGFETSANFVEEQQPGVFRKTMRNMWALASIYNIWLAVMSLGVLPLDQMTANPSVVLANMGLAAGGHWLQLWVAIDAFIVLSAGVLTGYVGITGLICRLSNDRVVPEFLSYKNKWRHTPHNISLSFFVVGSSLILVLNADATMLGNVFTFAFLSMMFLFGFGCIMLKLKRQDIPRAVKAPWWTCILGCTMVLLGYFGSLLGDPKVLLVFFLYFLVIAAVVFSMLERMMVLRFLIFVVHIIGGKEAPPVDAVEDVEANVLPRRPRTSTTKFFENDTHRVAILTRTIKDINARPIVFFVKENNLPVINKAILYVRNNEITHYMRFFHVYEEATPETMASIAELRDIITMFDGVYPKLHLDFVSVRGSFDQATILWISDEYKIPTNFMFIKQPSTINVHKISSLGPCDSPSKSRKRTFHITLKEDAAAGPSFIYPSEIGKHETLHPSNEELEGIREKLNAPKHLLSEWPATSIAGNDIMSSVMYSAGVVALKAGKLAPFCMVFVSCVLYMYRFIYEEVVTAIPLNGGSYNCLLNTTSKRVASLAAVLSIMAYMATAVVSSTSACYYLQSVVPDLPVVGTTVGVLGVFAILTFIGISESAMVALAMFSFHIVTLTILGITCLIFVIKNPEIIKANMHSAYPDVDFVGGMVEGNWFTALFFGFASSMLGVTGYESSSNYVEHQKPGVFRLTMRNMWAFSSVYNIFLAWMGLGTLPVHGPGGLIAKKDSVLSEMGLVAGGSWLQWLVCIDAFVVLSGAVLTSYVGINGLVRRLSSDRVLPAFLAQENKLRGTTHWIILSFFLLTSSLVIISNGNNVVLSGVYTYSFLSMMFLFAMGCMMLKIKRQDIPRDVKAPWWTCILGAFMIAIGYFGILLGDPTVLMYFFYYALGVGFIVFSMLGRVTVLRCIIFLVNLVCPSRQSKDVTGEIALEDNDCVVKEDNVRFFERENKRVAGLVRTIKSIKDQPFVFFIKTPDLTVLNKVILYVRNNEMTETLRFVHIYSEANEEAMANVESLREMIALFDRIYPKLRTDFVTVQGMFDAATVTWLAQEYNMPTNMMFIRQPTSFDAKSVSSSAGPSFIFQKELGKHESITPPAAEITAIHNELCAPKHLLGEWPSTAISGNDIMSSVMYSAGLVALKAGKLAPVCMAFVSVVLYMYRFIYEEVVTAIPMNGGSYNCLLNTTSKRIAAIAAVLSTLAYMATAVVSGTSACYYLQFVVPQVPVVGTTVGLLGVFAVLTFIGISESSMVALAMFTFHILTLTILAIASLIYTIKHPSIFEANMHSAYPPCDFVGGSVDGNVFTALFFGFAASMLGVTGFETSSNFVEQQQPGVFRKTMRNMWAFSTFYNIALAILGMGVMPVAELQANANTVLGNMGQIAGGSWLAWLVCIDAFVVLAGAVLTSYVGITGLHRRLSSDRVMPGFFAAENKWRGTNHWIILVFFLFTSSLVLLLDGDNVILGGVYTYAFLTMMFLFAMGCMMLKIKRQDIPRDIHAPWWACISGATLIAIGYFGILLGNPSVIAYFFYYALGVAFVVFLMLGRVTILRCLIFVLNLLPGGGRSNHTITNEVEIEASADDYIVKEDNVRFFERENKRVALLVHTITSIKTQPFVFFIKSPDLTTINKVILYVRRNEMTNTLRFVHVYPEETPGALATIAALQEMVALFDRIYPKLRIDLVTLHGSFDPATIHWLSKEYAMPTNMMFIKQPTNKAVHMVAGRSLANSPPTQEPPAMVTAPAVPPSPAEATDYAALQSPAAVPVGTRKRVFHITVDENIATGPSFIYQEELGKHENITPSAVELEGIRERLEAPKHLLGQWPSTAICGNDIMSSVMYSAGIVALKAGKLAPICMALVSLVLYMYRFIYEEVVTAIPMNGGSYNCLLNTTSKRFASIAAVLSILAYTATAVVSGTSACYYLQYSVPGLPVVGTTVGLLGFFALLTFIGIAESSLVALAMFIFHILTLSTLAVASLIYVIRHPDIIKDNFHTAYPPCDFVGGFVDGNVFTALFFGFSSAMLGVTGYESSSNFVEQQQPGVFRQTMRNMWAFSTFYNIVLAILGLGVLPIYGPTGLQKNANTVLANMGDVAGGKWLSWLVSIDAFVVLSGAVLTGYVGINGLVRRLSSDRVLPAFLADQNKWRGTNHWIILLFFLLTSSLVLLLDGNNVVLSGVYTYAFLSMMFLFAMGCMMLKIKRQDIPRDVHAPWWACISGAVLIVIGYFGVLLGDPTVLMYFLYYALGVGIVVYGMLGRVTVLRCLIFILNLLPHKGPRDDAITAQIQREAALEGAIVKEDNVRFFERENQRVVALVRTIKSIKTQPFVFFIKAPDLTTINKVILYVRNNEMTTTLRFVHVYPAATPEAMETIAALQEMIALFDRIYPKLKTDFVSVQAAFVPATVLWLSNEYGMPTNMMFIKQPTNKTVHKVSGCGLTLFTGLDYGVETGTAPTIFRIDYGKQDNVRPPLDDLIDIRAKLNARAKDLLSEWPSTALCGNDIMSSVLYSSGLVALKAGKLGPVSMVMVSFVLYMYRYIYEEVVTAIPINGGSYNCLLNTTTKRFASIAAVLSLLSYIATAVVSGTSACYYLDFIVPEIPVVGTTIALLGGFAVLFFLGLTESAVVALVIFVLHIVTLTILAVASLVYTIRNPSIFVANLHSDYPTVDYIGRTIDGSVVTALFFGFAASMLGVTGYETSANFVEHQQPGIFRKTMRNMWVLSSIFNIVLSVLAMGVLPIYGPNGLMASTNTVLANMGDIAGGPWLKWLVCIDAFCVLSGAVLTAYVGSNGLLRRLSTDRVLPRFLSKKNAWRGTTHWIILVFFLLTASLVWLLNGDNVILGGVYTYAFLTMMFLFAVGCMILKVKRQRIPRDVHAPWWTCLGGALSIAVGYLGIILGNPSVIAYFFYYTIGIGVIVFTMLGRVSILRCFLFIVNLVASPKQTEDVAMLASANAPTASRDDVDDEDEKFYERDHHRLANSLVQTIKRIKAQPYFFFIKTPDLKLMNKVTQYVRNNELTSNLRFVFVYPEATEEALQTIATLKERVDVIDRLYTKIKMDVLTVRGYFEPAMVVWLAKEFNLPPNMMFIKQPTNSITHKVVNRGVRVVTVLTPNGDEHPGLRRRSLHITYVEPPEIGPSFIYQDQPGVHENIIPSDVALSAIREKLSAPRHLLAEWPATAICGNDILSSVLYSAGLVALTAGKLAPVALAFVSLVLYLYRFIYEEVVTAIPMNGGSYNCLLNTTSKRFAAIAACLSILSYTATAVVSGTSASFYLQSQFTSLPVVGTTIGILGFFALLVLFGISESSIVALIIFSVHIITLTVLGITCLIYTIKNPQIFIDNYSTSYPDINFSGSMVSGNVFTAVFFGFSSAMLGVTGFESSSNFVEEQKPGVFRKTLRNMWALASVYNIFLSFMSLGVLPLNTPDGLIANEGVALAQMGLIAGGKWLQMWVAIDAFVVLSGAVLTSYVGINGLLRRLSTDRVVPQFFAAENSCRRTNHWIIIIFFLLAASLVWILDADNVILSGVYTYAFLSLMILFGVGCMMLKVKRTDIPRDVHAPWWSCIAGCSLIVIGFLGTLLGNPRVLMYFAFYFIAISVAIFLMLERVLVLRALIFLVNLLFKSAPRHDIELPEYNHPPVSDIAKRGSARFFEREGRNVSYLVRAIRSIKDQPILFFIKLPNLTTINKAILYVRNNEITDTLRFVHVYPDQSDESKATVDSLKQMIVLFDTIYPKLRTDFWTIQGTFDAAMVMWISEEYKIPTNMMFIKQPSGATAHKAASRGIRVITG
ncbi:transmembrane protein [Achlya hypogyna]|uniref:Transmembrane protein n=1 Tax=Achlya hypogyna TaxID=1202772 RepID=A0A1V9Z791_ACHHY|nr:transmembrane protein [Achlya hypogyna]